MTNKIGGNRELGGNGRKARAREDESRDEEESRAPEWLRAGPFEVLA